jgi:hypothetical protein
MRVRLRFALALTLVLTSACSHTLSLTLPPGTPVRVSGYGAEPPFMLDPNSVAYRDLTAWIDQNRTGWSRYRVTTPGGGTFVTAGSLQLQFLGSSVMAYTPDGAFDKAANRSECSFLRR